MQKDTSPQVVQGRKGEVIKERRPEGKRGVKKKVLIDQRKTII